MKRAIEQETLQALVETGAVVSSDQRRRSLAPGTAPRQQVATGALAARTSQVLAVDDGGGAVLRRGGHQRADGRALNSVVGFKTPTAPMKAACAFPRDVRAHPF